MSGTGSVSRLYEASWVAIAAALVLLVGGVGFAVGQEEEPTPPNATATPAPTTQPAPIALGGGFAKTNAPSAGQSLGGGLGRVELTGTGGGGPIVIEDSNLESMGQGAVVSEGSVNHQRWRPRGQRSARAGSGRRYRQQLQVVQTLEGRLKAFDASPKPPEPDIYHRAPGTVSDHTHRRRQLTDQIAAERAKAEALRKEGGGVHR